MKIIKDIHKWFLKKVTFGLSFIVGYQQSASTQKVAESRPTLEFRKCSEVAVDILLIFL